MRAYFTHRDADDIMDFITHHARQALATVCVTALPDPGDAPFLEVALTEEAPLITGDKRHFPPAKRAGCLVLTSAEFLARFAPRAP